MANVNLAEDYSSILPGWRLALGPDFARSVLNDGAAPGLRIDTASLSRGGAKLHPLMGQSLGGQLP